MALRLPRLVFPLFYSRFTAQPVTPLLINRTMSSSLKPVFTAQAPKALGPYSQAIVANNQVYLSGQIGFTPEGVMVGSDVQSQTRQALTNAQAVLRSAHSDLDKVIKTTVFLQDMDDFDAMNHVYAEMFGEHRPARSAFQVAKLPKGALVEIECVALVNSD
ncbi:hypothetical protein IWQ61_006929 [Dispira simplex]|nr:hypothetical protein IWQ61_006929 [Dispira simplex]